MKKAIITIVLAVFFFSSYSNAAGIEKQIQDKSSAVSSEKELFVLLTNGDKEVLTKMVAPYLNVAAKSWEKRTLLIWGPSEKTIAENPDLKELIAKLKDGGVILKACKWCAEQYMVGDVLSSLGFEVAYMGTPLTEALQSNMKVMIF